MSRIVFTTSAVRALIYNRKLHCTGKKVGRLCVWRSLERGGLWQGLAHLSRNQLIFSGRKCLSIVALPNNYKPLWCFQNVFSLHNYRGGNCPVAGVSTTQSRKPKSKWRWDHSHADLTVGASNQGKNRTFICGSYAMKILHTIKDKNKKDPVRKQTLPTSQSGRHISYIFRFDMLRLRNILHDRHQNARFPCRLLRCFQAFSGRWLLARVIFVRAERGGKLYSANHTRRSKQTFFSCFKEAVPRPLVFFPDVEFRCALLWRVSDYTTRRAKGFLLGNSLHA